MRDDGLRWMNLFRTALVLLGAAALSGCGASTNGTRTASEDESSSSIPSGTLFRDPDGTYAMEIDDGWTPQRDGVAADSEAWRVGASDPGQFQPSVVVVTYDTPGADLSEFLGDSAQSLERLPNTEVIDLEIIDGTFDELAVLEFSHTRAGHDLQFVQIAATNGEVIITALFAAAVDDFEKLRPEVEPLLHTLRAT